MRGGSHFWALLQGPLHRIPATFFCSRFSCLACYSWVPLCSFTGIMTSRQTNNSQEAALFGILLSVAATNTTSTGSTSSSVSQAAVPSVATSSGPPSGLPVPFSPELAAFLSQTVQAAVQSHFAASSAQPVPFSAAVSIPPASLAASGAFPLH